jgi:hypothetical protein
MLLARWMLVLTLAAALGGCFVKHPTPPGEPVATHPGQYSGLWVAEPLEADEAPGYFLVTDVDPAQGSYSVEEADATGAPNGAPLALKIRRVGDALFVATQDSPDKPWVLFVVAEYGPDRVALVWKPVRAAFEQYFASGALAGTIADSLGADESDIDLAALSPDQMATLARDWSDLFKPDAIIFARKKE